MLDKNIPAEAKIIDEMKKYVSKSHGISFGLAMRDPEGNVSFIERNSQPCYGELRKYHKSHGKEYTDPQPHDEYRPGDLHSPFPKGIPEAVAIPTFGNSLSMFHKDMLSAESPYPLGDHSSIILEDKGFIIIDTMIDPTVFVNMLNAMRSVNLAFYQQAREAGLTVRQAFALVTNFQSFGSPNYQIGYYYSPAANFWRIENRSPNDLTGGLFRDRYDYNRKILHDVFSVMEGEVKINHQSEFNKKKVDVSKLFNEWAEYYDECVVRQTPETKVAAA